MAKTKPSKKKKPADNADVLAKALAGLVHSAVLMAASDGEAADEEIETIRATIRGFVGDENADEKKIDELISTTAEALQNEGLEAVLSALPQLLPGELTTPGLQVAALVMISDQNAADEEAQVYGMIAKALGFSKSQADKILADIKAEVGFEDGEE